MVKEANVMNLNVKGPNRNIVEAIIRAFALGLKVKCTVRRPSKRL